MNFKPADIIISMDKKSLFSRSILSVLRFFQSDPVDYQHSMLVIDENRCIEANLKVEISILTDRFADLKRYKVIRHRHLTDEQRQGIVNKAYDLLGLDYSFLRMGLQLLDQIFNTNYFTRRIGNPDQQICSSLVAWCYNEITRIKFNRVKWNSVEPDDIDDESLRNPIDWEIIQKWEMS